MYLPAHNFAKSLFIYLLISLRICCLFTCLSVFGHLSIHLTVYLSICVCIELLMNSSAIVLLARPYLLSIRLFICLSARLSLYVFICLAYFHYINSTRPEIYIGKHKRKMLSKFHMYFH